MRSWLRGVGLVVLFTLPAAQCLVADEPAAPTEAATDAATDDVKPVPAVEPGGETITDTAAARANEIVAETTDKVEEIAEKLDQSEQAKEAMTKILLPIYTLAESLAFPAFHWLAFAIMVAGVISFALQLVLAKLAVLLRMGLSLTEILSDAMGLVISLLGLVLTTQAAAENSTFTTSPAAVLSATAMGAVVGFVFYLWGQAAEIQAVEGRRVRAAKKVADNKQNK